MVKAIPGVVFADAFGRRAVGTWQGVEVSVIGLDDLIPTKKASGRDQDLIDVHALGRDGVLRFPLALVDHEAAA